MAELIPLQQIYLLAISEACKALHLDCLLQDLGDGKTGRLWLVHPGRTVAYAQLAFAFDHDDVTLGIITRDERELVRVVKYVEGIEDFIEAMTRFFHAGRLAAPKQR